MNGQEFLTGLVNQLKPQADQREADGKLESARDRFKKVIERLFKTEVERIGILIEEPDRYSVREWEKVLSEVQWAAKRLMALAERMEELRPVTGIDDTPEPAAKDRRRAGKLSEAEVSQIKRLVNEGQLSLEEIAQEFWVSPAEISAIKNERSWPLVEPRIVARLDRYEAKGRLVRRI